MSNTFRNPKLYTTDRGLTKKDQETPVEQVSVDASWMKAGPIEGEKAGTVAQADTYQKFVPYQTKFESTKNNTWGFAKQDSKEHPWVDYTESTWADPLNFPPNFKGDYDIQKWYSSKLETEKELFQWKTDIFGNQYGLYKNFSLSGVPITMYDRNLAEGELWVSSVVGTIFPGISALHRVFANYLALDSTIYSSLTGNHIVDIDTFYDTLMIVTPEHITLDRISVDYDTGDISSIADYTHILHLGSTEQFADTWFFDQNKIVMLCTVQLSAAVPIPQIYELNLNKSTLMKRFPIEGSDLTLLQGISANNFDAPLFTYNSNTQTYNVAFMVNDGSSTIVVNIVDNITKLKVDSVREF